MQERRLLPSDWVTKHKAATIKCGQLQQDFPQLHSEKGVNLVREFMHQQLKENQQNQVVQNEYRLAKKVFTRLIEQTEEGKLKTLFGSYKSPLVKEWQLLLRIYESDNLYLAEYGKCVQQVYGFDLPSMKKQLGMLSKQINEGVSKCADLKRAAKEQELKFNQDCQKLEIVPSLDQDALEKQLLGALKQVVPIFKQIERMVRDKDQGLGQVIEYYKEFNKTQNYMNDITIQMLQYFLKYGDENVKAFEFRKRHPTKHLPSDIQKCEDSKYQLYSRMYEIVNGITNTESEQVFEITMDGALGQEKQEEAVLDMDWDQIEALKVVDDGVDEKKEHDAEL